MKKVLALVLAVIMVCTMAFAATGNAVTVVPGGSGSNTYGTVELADKYDANNKYVLELDDAFFKVLDTYLNNPTAMPRTSKVEGVAGSFNEGKSDCC